MASLEDRLADKEYKYWVKAGICLSYVKSGLEVFAEERSKKTHDYVNANCIGPNQPGNICNHARIEYNRRAGKWISNCCNDCQKYVDEIVKLQVPPFTFNKYNWQNSNIHQWPTDAWEMMKVFMNPGQKVYQKSPKETDLSGLINFIDHCSVPNVDIQNKINISQVRDGRNSIMHSATMRITELEFMTYTNYMIGLLEDPLFMCFIPEAQLASSTIKEIQAATFQILKSAEFEVLREKTTELKNLNEQLRDEVDDLHEKYGEMQASLNKETMEIKSLIKEEATRREEGIRDIRYEIQTKEQRLKELSTELILIKRLIHQDGDLFKKLEFRVGSVEVTLHETSNQLQEMKPHLDHLKAQVDYLFRMFEPNSSDPSQDNPQEEVTSLRKQNNELEKKLENVTKKVAEASMNITKVTVDKEMAMLREENSKLECEIRDLRVDRQKLQLENNQLQESSMGKIKREFKQCMERNEALECELERTKTNDLKCLEKRLMDLHLINSCLELEFWKARAQIEDLNHHNEILRQANSKLESARECTISRNDALQAHVSQLTEKIEEQRTQIDSLLETTGMFSADGQKDLLADFDLDLKLEKQKNEENANDEKKSATVTSIESKYAELRNNYQTLLRNSELHKNKTNQRFEEKDDHIEQLQERVKTLEQQRHNKALSKQALEKERDSLEMKLKKTREQLSETKLSLIHLEDQKQELETALNQMKMEKIDVETQLRDKITYLESQLVSLKAAKQHEQLHLEDLISHLRKREEELVEENLKTDKKMKEFEETQTKLKEEIQEKAHKCKKLTFEKEAKETCEKELSSQISSLTLELGAAKESLEATRQSYTSKNSELQRSNQERDDLMLRNWQLSQELQTVKKILEDEKSALEKDINGRMETENIQRQKYDQLQESCDKLREETQELETTLNQVKKEKVDVETQLREKVISLESQLDFLQTAELHEKSRLEDLITHLQKREEELVEENLKTEKKMKDIEETQTKLKIYRAMESENFKDLTVASLDRVNITLPNDGYHPDITGCTFMQNGNIVLCDYSNSCIKILSDTFTIKDSLQLKSQPWDVSPVNNSSVVITVPEKRKIQFIQMVPKTKLGHSIKVDTSCWGVQVVMGLIYVTSRANKGTREVLVLDMKGRVKERFERSTWNLPMFTDPGYITVCSSSSKMFVTEYGADTISCLKTNGNVVYQYYNQELRDPRGICADGGENIIICGLESNNVQVIRVDGTKRYTLLTSQDGVSNPRSIAHRQSDNTLILGCWNKENLSVYKLNRPTESEKVKELGQLSIDSVKHPMSASKDTLFTEMRVASKSEVSIEMSGESLRPWISGCTFMPNGDVVLCDERNNKIKLLSDTFTTKDSLQLDSKPWDVSPVSSSSAVITLPYKNQLQFIQVMPLLKKLDRSINIGRKCWGIQVVEDLIYVTCYNVPGEGEVIVLDMNGTITHRLRHTDKKPPMFSYPVYITVCPSTRKLFITDCDKDTVSCLLSDGTVVYQYKDAELRRPRGVCVDGGGNAIVCGFDSNNVQVIRADGTKCCTLLTSQDGVSDPYSVAYRQSDNNLILGCYSKNNLLVYKMK